MSRRAADKAIQEGRVSVNGHMAQPGQEIAEADSISLDGRLLGPVKAAQTIMLHKPAGYVVSREGQGSKTIYDLLPSNLHHLKPVGRLDKDSSGLLLLTNDGQLAQELTHPKYQKTKVYEIELDKPLSPEDKAKIERGVMLEDGLSSLQLTAYSTQQPQTKNSKLLTVNYRVTMHEGRNRQIRRTIAALGYSITRLHRIQFGAYTLPPSLKPGTFQTA